MLVGFALALLFTQLAMAAYACPRLAAQALPDCHAMAGGHDDPAP